MERVIKNEESESNGCEYFMLCLEASLRGTFGHELHKLNIAQLKRVKTKLKELMDMESKIWTPGKIGRFILNIRKGISNLAGEKFDSVPEKIRIIERLQDELEMEIRKRTEQIKPAAYMQNFLDYLNSLDEKEKGPNATHLKVRSYVKIGPEQIEPDKDKDGKVVISFRLSFEKNLAFIKEHMNEAVIRNNLRETEMRLQQEREKHYP